MLALCSLRRGCAAVLVRALLANADRARDPTLHVWDRAEAAGNSVRNSSGTRHESGVLIAVDIFRSHRLEANTLVLSACLLRRRCSSRRRSWPLRRCSVRCSSSRAAVQVPLRPLATAATRRACSRTRSSLPKLSLRSYRFSPGCGLHCASLEVNQGFDSAIAW